MNLKTLSLLVLLIITGCSFVIVQTGDGEVKENEEVQFPILKKVKEAIPNKK